MITRDSPDNNEDEVEGDIGRSFTPTESRFHYNPKLEGSADEREFDIECNYRELLSQAFAAAADKMCGEGHGLELRLENGGAYGEADPPAKESLLLLVHGPTETCSHTDEVDRGVDVGKGGVNVPWGVLRTPLPRVHETAVIEMFRTVLSSLGLQANAPNS